MNVWPKFYCDALNVWGGYINPMLTLHQLPYLKISYANQSPQATPCHRHGIANGSDIIHGLGVENSWPPKIGEYISECCNYMKGNYRIL